MTDPVRLAWRVSFAVILGCGGEETAVTDGGTDAAAAIMPACDRAAGPFAPLSTRCQHFVDADGRVVVLRGINARVEGSFDVDLGPDRVPLEPIPPFGADDATAMRALGLNVLRLPIQWSGVEPEDADPPAYAEAYLAGIERVADLCADAGMYVLIDFHQDAYSKWIGEDGAPLWAIQPPPDAILEGPLDDLDERRTSTQVLRAFETFFGDAEPGPTLRTRFAAMVAHVAAHFADHPAIIGYEVSNEPIADDDRTLRLNVQVAEAIRAVSRQLVFFEPPVIERNLSDRSGMPSAPFPVEGAVYAPHVYTLAFFGTEEQRLAFTRETLRRGNRSAAREALAWGTPLFIGEFGYDPNGIRAAEYYEAQLSLQDEYGASSAVWLWKENSQGRWGFHDYDGATWSLRPEMVAVFDRAFPERIAGWPVRWSWDEDAGRFELHFEGSDLVIAPNVLRLPEGDWTVTCDAAAVSATRDARGLAEIRCGGPGMHAVVATRR